MQGSAEILQEYLVKLGYQVDASSYLKFNENLNSTQKRLFGIGTAAAAAVAATVAATTKFAYTTRKAFFAAELAGATPNSVKAFGRAAEQIGVSSDAAEASIKQFGITMNNTPGMKGFFESITGKPASTDSLENYLTLLGSIKKMFPDTAEGRGIASQFAEQFGISKEEYLLMSERLGELTAKTGKFKAEQDTLFTKQDQEKLKDYANQVDTIGNSFTNLGEALLYKFGPALTAIAKDLESKTKTVVKWGRGEIGFWEMFNNPLEMFSPSGVEKRKAAAKASKEGSNQAGLTGTGDVNTFLKGIKGVESSGGNYKAKNPLSSASGAYQFIDSTWKSLTKKYGMGQEYGSAKLAPKEIQDAIAQKYASELLQQYGGDMGKAANVWYTGNPQGQMTAEGLAANRGFTSQQYQDRFNRSLGGNTNTSTANNVTIKNDFNVTGTDAQSISKSIAMTIQRQIGDVTRNTVGLQP